VAAYVATDPSLMPKIEIVKRNSAEVIEEMNQEGL